MQDLLPFVAFGVALFLAYGILRSLLGNKRNPQRLAYPPGPKPDPVIGNLRHLPAEYPWKAYTEMSKTHGKYIHLEVFGQHLLVLNSFAVADELLNKRSLYNGRPKIHMAGEMMGWERIIGLSNYGDRWRTMRKIAHTHLNKVASNRFQPEHLRQRGFYLKRLLDNPENFRDDFRLAAGRAILRATYNIEPESVQSRFITVPGAAVAALGRAAIPGAYLVDSFPILKKVPAWFPGAGFKQFAKEARALTDEMAEAPFDLVKKQLLSGASVRPSIISIELAESIGDERMEEMLTWIGATMLFGGSDTAVSSMGTFYLAMLHYPDVLKKAQAEIDAVIGSHRLPTFDDRERLPYVDALVKEVHRWYPVLPLGNPHKTLEDDIYQGYYIPSDTVVFFNSWAMSRDEDVYPEADEFRPERYFVLNKEGQPPLDPTKFTFGFGRRVCSGLHFAEHSLFIMIASVIATFNITPDLDENGKEIIPPRVYTNSLVSNPLDFKCRVTPRSPEAVALIEAATASLDE